ncbi:glycosyl transferase [Luteolibacter yonseiensis]|uniref:Glycosyl transferase n=1 Tax=Luteolibacter yonseiensis TaxID=1144680 RepID=A0A934VA92_9BACT|nr:glycosyl transferase [Luteolibacter yonseiensis]MBK1814910.1 glycosyl transferase [Luteolibacter yonseiensis]
MSTKLILCMKWGTVYGPEYVNILHAMVARNITGPFKVVCFTDDPTGVREEVLCRPLPPLGCEIPPDVPGKWPKVALWSKDLDGLEGLALFIDLDSVIVSNIDGYFSHGNPEDVITARNWVRPFSKAGQTSVFRFQVGRHPYMLENLQADPANLSRKYQFEQNYVTAGIHGGIRFWPPEWTKHFGLHSMGIWPLRYLRPPVLPAGVKIVTFPGRPKPPDAIAGRWSGNSQPRRPLEQLRWVWNARKTEKNWRRHFSRFVLPSAWVAEHWRE